MSRAVVLMVVLVSACTRSQSASPSDSGVASVLEGLWNERNHRILVGEMHVVDGPNDFEKARISPREFKEVEAWAKLRLVTLEADDILSENKQFSWGDWLARVGEGKMKKIKVVPTELGLKTQAEGGFSAEVLADKRLLNARFYRVSVKTIAENKELEKDVDRFRVVKGVMETSWTDVGRKLYETAGFPMIRSKKFICLLKWDSFSKRWLQVALDTAQPDSQFSTTNVEKALASK